MKPLDLLKAFALGVLVLALNVLVLVVVMFVYSLAVAPGHAPAFYNEAAPRFGAITAPIAGIILLFVTAWLFGRRRPERNATLFGLAVYVSYFAVDTAAGLAMGPISSLLTPPFLIGLGGGLLATLAGAALSRRKVDGDRAKVP